MTDPEPKGSVRRRSWFTALSPAGRVCVGAAGLLIAALVVWSACLAVTAPSDKRSASVSALISSVASLVALFVAATTAGERRLDALKEDAREEADAARRASLLQCTVAIDEEGDRPLARITLTNYGASTFTEIDFFLAGRNIRQLDDYGHVEARDPRAVSAFRDWRDAPTGTFDEAAMGRVAEGFLGPKVTALGPAGQITIEAGLPKIPGANWHNLKPIYQFTDLDGAHWENEDGSMRHASEFDENGRHRWFRQAITVVAGPWENEK